MIHDEFDTDTENLEPPTPRDIITTCLWITIGVTLVGYLAFWKMGII